MQWLKKIKLLSLLIFNITAMVYASEKVKKSDRTTINRQELINHLSTTYDIKGDPEKLSDEQLLKMSQTLDRAKKQFSPLEQEKRPLAHVNSNSTPSTQNRTYVSSEVIDFCKTAVLCCLGSGIVASIVTVSVLFTKYTHVVNKNDYPVEVERQYSLTSPVRKEIIYPSEQAWYPHNTWNKFCIKPGLFDTYDKHCLSSDERESGNTHGCDDLELRIKENENNGDPKFVIKKCDETKRRLNSKTPYLRGSVSGLQLDDVLSKQEQKTYFDTFSAPRH